MAEGIVDYSNLRARLRQHTKELKEIAAIVADVTYNYNCNLAVQIGLETVETLTLEMIEDAERRSF